jgi:hypothetical protein
MTIRTRGAGANGALTSASNSCIKSARSCGYGMPLAVVRPSRASAIAASNSSSIRRQGRASNPAQWSHAPTRRELDSLRGPAQALFELGKEAKVMVYVGMDVHRKRSQVSILDDSGTEVMSRNVPNDCGELMPILGRREPGTQWRWRPRTDGGGSPIYWTSSDSSPILPIQQPARQSLLPSSRTTSWTPGRLPTY